ncbi:hypothetical protein [Priestia aryabhattai]
MSTHSLPDWFWIIFHLAILLTIGLNIVFVIKRKYSIISLVNLPLMFILYIAFFIKGFSRDENLNEYQYLVKSIEDGAVWAIFVALGHLYFTIWWFIVLKKKFIK